MGRALRVLLAICLLATACTAGAPDDSTRTTEAASARAAPSDDPRETVEGPLPSASEPQSEPPPAPVRRRLRLVGSTDLGGRGFNGDVWAHEGIAYIGNWGAINDDTDCPADGVRVVDVRTPSKPRPLATLQNPEGTSSDDVTVISAQTPAFTGSLAVIGIQACHYEPSVFHGLQFFDVTNPRKPSELGRWEAPDGTVGCHEVDLVQSAQGRILAGCANPAAVRSGEDEAVIVDATNPRKPALAAAWTNEDVELGDGVGCLDFSVVHNVRFTPDGLQAWVSYWDAGTMLLDLQRPTEPKLVTRLESGQPDEDCDNHSIGLSPEGILLVNHEDFSPALPASNFEGCDLSQSGWGGITVYDVTTPKDAQRLGEYSTRGSQRESMRSTQINTVHNTEFAGADDAFVSWYSEGVRWLDLSDPARPREVDHWIPPAKADPHGFFPDAPLVWGIAPMAGTNLVLASDINGGLYVLRAVGLPVAASA